MRLCFVVRFKDSGNNGTKSFKTWAKSPKSAGKKLRKKGARVISVRKA